MNHHKKVYLKDYTPPSFLIPNINLSIELSHKKTRITSILEIIKNFATSSELILNGENLELEAISIDGKKLSQSEYKLDEKSLTLKLSKNQHSIEIITVIHPEKNLSLEGIYTSDKIICSQNEPEGFRKITYFLDRPDILSTYTTTLIANKTDFPTLLSNGNCIKKEPLENNFHSVTWHDPHPKPCYLFAVVAGEFGKYSDSFITKSKRKIELEIYTDLGNEKNCSHAMESLKKSMAWDEKTYNLEYDLDIFMIVAVDAFNMGAMENKGLNIFNAAYILADPQTATDTDYKNIEAIIAHEYFHNWTGNRVTCRDWFQLTLKEGLTVFRDQEFSSDMNHRTLERINNIRQLRESQFTEDASPMAHPIKPSSYIEINNFYTATVYEKGAEVIRMIETLIGKENFNKGLEIYFKEFDGQAVTTEDFIWAMETSSGCDFTQFKYWYTQAGTPECHVSSEYNKETNTFSLSITQECKKTPETKIKKPFYFPIKTGLINPSGKEIAYETILMDSFKKKVDFPNIKQKPIPSLLRDYSAPVNISYDYSENDLITLIKHDSNTFNRCESMTKFHIRVLQDLIAQIQSHASCSISTKYLSTVKYICEDTTSDIGLISEMLKVPSLSFILENTPSWDVDAANTARNLIQKAIATHCEAFFLEILKKYPQPTYSIQTNEMSKRSLKLLCLDYLSKINDSHYSLITNYFNTSTNMTDQLGSLRILVNFNHKETDVAVDSFYLQWKNHSLIINKWLAVQMLTSQSSIFTTLKKLQKHPSYNNKNPNKCRSLIGTFINNLPHFHCKSGKGYEILSNEISRIDSFNPSIAARLAYGFKKYKTIDSSRKEIMAPHLKKLLDTPSLSKNSFEIIEKIYNDI